MTPPGNKQAAEIVTVVEHKAFTDLYRDELSQEGLPIQVVDIDHVPRTTVTIYPDAANKDLVALEVLIPRLSRGYRIEPHLESIDFDEIRRAFQSQFEPLPLGHPQEREINYEGRHLITNEIVEQMRIKLTLLTDGMGAISFFREELERATRIRGQHAKLAPLIQRFLEELLFGEKVTLYDKRVLARLGDTAVREHIRATFVPIILKKITSKKERLKEEVPQSVCSWRPFQATASERHPVIIAKKTPFNLVPCNLQLEVAMCDWLDLAGDVAAFAKNAGPQALRIDYLTAEGRRAIYTPDFLIRKTDGAHILMETKGQADKDVPLKARAASEWCRAASTKRARWSYVYVPQAVFERFSGDSVEELAETCAPSLVELIRESESPQFVLDFEKPDRERLADQVTAFVDADTFEKLPLRDRKAIEHAVQLFHMQEEKALPFAPVFQPLLGRIDDAAEALLLGRLSADVPAESAKQKDFFEPDMSGVKARDAKFYLERARTAKRLLVHRNPIMPTGLLVFCLRYAAKDTTPAPGIFSTIRARMSDLGKTNMLELIEESYNFRNTYIAHEKTNQLTDVDQTRQALGQWVEMLTMLHASVETAR